MHIASRGIIRITLLACALDTAHLFGSDVGPQKAPDPAHSKFELSVDSIMRGPRLVGYPPTGLRWSGDSSRLYFEWRRPGEDEASTWVVDRDGGQPRKLNGSSLKKKVAPD